MWLQGINKARPTKLQGGEETSKVERTLTALIRIYPDGLAKVTETPCDQHFAALSGWS